MHQTWPERASSERKSKIFFQEFLEGKGMDLFFPWKYWKSQKEQQPPTHLLQPFLQSVKFT